MEDGLRFLDGEEKLRCLRLLLVVVGLPFGDLNFFCELVLISLALARVFMLGLEKSVARFTLLAEAEAEADRFES